MRGHLEGDADVLALDGGEGVVGARSIGGEGAGLEGHVLAHQDFRPLVVQCQQAGGRQQVALAVGREGGDQGGEVVGADADDGAVRQGVGDFVVADGVEHRAHRESGIAEVHAAQAAGAATGIHGPLHTEGIGDVAGNLHDGRFHHHLGAGHVELADYVFHGGDHVRFGQHHQGVEALVGADQDVLRPSAAGHALFATAAAFLAFQAFGNLAEGFGKRLGVVVAQADHPGIGRARGGGVEGLRQACQLVPGGRRAEDDQAVGAGVGDHLGARGALGLAAIEGSVEHLGRVHHPGVAQVQYRVVAVALLVELAHQVFDARDVGGAVADDQGVGGGHGGQVAVLGDQWSNQRDELRHRSVLHLDHPGLQALGAGAAAAGLGLGFGIGNDARLIALGDHGEAVSGHHRKEQLVDLVEPERRLGDHADLAFHPRVDDEGLAGDVGDLVDELADIGILEVDGPAILLLLLRVAGRGAGRLGGERRQRRGQQAGGEQGEREAREGRGHRVIRFPEAVRRKDRRARCPDLPFVGGVSPCARATRRHCLPAGH
ncbi:hypothetical protein D9M68_411340 [compost metagenome]